MRFARTQCYCIHLIQPGPRPPFYSIAEHLWGAGCDIDSDGNSQTPEDTQWTELTLTLRTTGERVDIDPISAAPLILNVRGESMQVVLKVANFIIEHSGGKMSLAGCGGA